MPARPQLGAADFAVLIWRAKGLMAAVFLPIATLGLLIALQMPQTYTASSRLLATLDDFYVYRPLAGGDAAGVSLEQEQIIQAELEILQSPVIAQRVLRQIGLERVYPDLAQARTRAITRGRQPAEQIERNAFLAGVEALQENLKVSAAPETPIIHARFEHKEAGTSAEVLNAMIETYLRYRAELLTDTLPDGFATQREAFQDRLDAAEADISAFLENHGITDFDAERARIAGQLDAVETDLLTARSRLSAVAGQLASLRQQLAETERDVDIFVEDTTEQRLVELRLEREDLLSRYTEQSQPVRAIDQRIAQIEAFLARQQDPVGTVRRGRNPVHQALATETATLEGQARSLREQVSELERQASELRARQALLVSLAPQWQALQRTRDLAARGVVDYATRETEARTRSQLAQQNADNIRVLEPARAPIEGDSLRLPVAVLSILLAGFTALMAGLAWIFTRRGLPTPAALSRTSGLPVLAAVAKGR